MKQYKCIDLYNLPFRVQDAIDKCGGIVDAEPRGPWLDCHIQGISSYVTLRANRFILLEVDNACPYETV